MSLCEVRLSETYQPSSILVITIEGNKSHVINFSLGKQFSVVKGMPKFKY